MPLFALAPQVSGLAGVEGSWSMGCKGHPGTGVQAESCPGSAPQLPAGTTVIQYQHGNPLLGGKIRDKYQLRLWEAGS